MHDDDRDNESTDDEHEGGADFDPKEYGAMLVLERLESLEEDMVDLGVSTLDEVRTRIADLHRALDDE
jgi:hypothetical protein